jgi:hypothetical protein
MGGLAFLLASTPAHNSDLWLHLASGRWLLSKGGLPDGTDPFSSTTQGVFWVNHTWLSDRILYQIYKLGGGTALVVGKAILIALLAALLFCFRRRGEGSAVLPLAVLAALLALGPWLLVQPALVSLLGVVLTLYLLERPSLLEGDAAARARRGRWLLVPLFALWANLDGWFVLGPVLVGLYALGELPRNPSRARSVSEGRTLANASGSVVLFCAGLAACLATPYHYRIFAWPIPLGLTQTEQALQHDPLGQTLVLSPFGERFASSAIFRSPGAWAYYFLLAASAVSFALSFRSLHLGRLLVWLVLAALSIYQARAIPFFAVAAAPFLALNVQEWARNRSFTELLHRLRSVALRLGVLAGIVLLVLAWPGWLQPAPYHSRGWTAEPDDSLARLAEQLNRWHAEGRFRSDRFALTLSPEAAHYLAWFCPLEKGFLDSRWPLFDRVVGDYVQMRGCLLSDGDAGTDQELALLLDAHRIDRILVYDSDWDRTTQAYRRLFQANAEWELLALEGGATLFQRRSAGQPFADAFDSRRAAYHPAGDQQAPPAPRSPRAPEWFAAFVHTADEHTADRKEAALHLLAFDLQANQQRTDLVRNWHLAQATGLLGSGWGREPAGTASALALRLELTPLLSDAAQPEETTVAQHFAAAYLMLHDGGPSEPLLLAVRAARRALAANPEDGGAFLLLGEAYLRLTRQTEERNWQLLLPALAELRQAQILTALEQAVLLRPDLERAHDLLAQLYFVQGQMDRCLDHRRAQLQIAQRNAKHGSPEAGERLTALQSDVENMEKLVNNSEKTYQANLAGKTDPTKVLLRAQLAARYGLSRKALELLLESSPAIFGRAGVEYQLDLMMKAGQSYRVRDWLEPAYEHKIESYHGVKARAAAGCGDYAQADAELDRVSEPLRRPVPVVPKVEAPMRTAAAFSIARAVLDRPLPAPSVLEALAPLRVLVERLRQEADQQVLRGLVAVEAGAVEQARQHFRAALDLWGSDAVAAAGGGLDFPTRPIAQQMLQRLQR